MFGNERDVVCVTRGPEAVKILYGRRGASGLRVLRIARILVQDVPDDQIIGAVQSQLKGIPLKKCRRLYALTAEGVIIKNIEIPSQDPEEIRSIIDLQAGRHTPYSREEILVGYCPVGIVQRLYTQVLLVLMNRNSLKDHLALFQAAGLRIDEVVFAPEAMLLFYAADRSQPADAPPFGVIDVGDVQTHFLVGRSGGLVTCRSIPIGLRRLIQEPEASRGELIDEVARSLEAYAAEELAPLPGRWIVTTDEEPVASLVPALQERLKAPVQAEPYLDRIQAAEPVMARLVSEGAEASFFETAAAAAAGGLRIDLTPEELRMQRALEEQGRQIVVAGVLALGLLFLVCAIFLAKVHFRDAYLERLKRLYDAQHRDVVALERIADRTQIIKDFLRDRMAALDVIEELYRLIPKEIYLENIRLDEEARIHIRGISTSMSRVFSLVTALEDSSVFKGVKTLSTTAKKDRGRDVAAFEIAFRLESAPDEDDDETGEEASDEGGAGGEKPGK